MKKCLLLLTMALFVSSLAAGAAAQIIIQPGVDLFETPPGHTQIDSFPTPLPADFFGPGSDPFDGIIALRGGSLGQECNPGAGLGKTSTIVERLSPAPFTPGVFPESQQIPIQIIALELRSIEPITVTYQGINPEAWDVRVNLSSEVAQSEGSMTITREYENGGTYDAYLPVTARLTFTNRETGDERVIDPFPQEWMETPINPLPPAPAPSCWSHDVYEPHLESDGGCSVDHDGNPLTPPVIVPPSSNNFVASFCGFTPTGQRPVFPQTSTTQQKVVNQEQALYAMHGVQPANPTEHYKVYNVFPKIPAPHVVTLQDQFDDATSEPLTPLLTIDYFANPVNKNNEGIGDLSSHLTWYRLVDPTPDTLLVEYENQFESDSLKIGLAEYLLVPTEKNDEGYPYMTDHYKCYRVIQGDSVGLNVTLVDQFEEATDYDVGKPVWFCTPVDKNDEGIINDVDHLVFYELDPKTIVFESPYIENQLDTFTMDVDTVMWLGVPTEKLQWSPVVSAVDDGGVPPVTFALHQNVPNPFNPTTTIRYEVPYDRAHVTLKIYDVRGQLVRTLVDDIHSAGIKEAFWDARNAEGREVASGIYFYRLMAAGFDQTRKMVLLR